MFTSLRWRTSHNCSAASLDVMSPAVASQRPSRLNASDHSGRIADGQGRPEPLRVAQVPESQVAVLRRGRDRPSVRRKRDRGDLPPGTHWDASGARQRPAVEHVDIACIIGDGEAAAVGRGRHGKTGHGHVRGRRRRSWSDRCRSRGTPWRFVVAR